GFAVFAQNVAALQHFCRPTVTIWNPPGLATQGSPATVSVHLRYGAVIRRMRCCGPRTSPPRLRFGLVQEDRPRRTFVRPVQRSAFGGFGCEEPDETFAAIAALLFGGFTNVSRLFAR